MSTPTRIIDPTSGREALVGIGNALAVGPPQPSVAYNATLGVDDVVVNIVSARGGKSFCMTGIILTGNKSIDPNTDAIVDIYTATLPTSATAVATLLSIPVARSAQAIVTGILLEAGDGLFINGKTSDDDVLVTILGFYID